MTDKKSSEESKTTKEEKEEKEVKTEESVKFKGKYISTLGKRKTAVARVRLYKNGKGAMIVNGMKLSSYFSQDKVIIANQPLKLTSHLRDLDFSFVVKGGGKSAQAEAIRHGITRGLLKLDEKLKETFKAKGWLTRDARKKERKKPGLKKARKAPQWSKR